MANKSNLIPLNKRSPEEVKRIVSMGGIASGEARRERKKTLETLEMLLAQKIKTDAHGRITREEACMLSAIRRCIERGEVDFLEFIAKLRGEMVNKSEVDVGGAIPAVLTDVCEDDKNNRR